MIRISTISSLHTGGGFPICWIQTNVPLQIANFHFNRINTLMQIQFKGKKTKATHAQFVIWRWTAVCGSATSSTQPTLMERQVFLFVHSWGFLKFGRSDWFSNSCSNFMERHITSSCLWILYCTQFQKYPVTFKGENRS